MFKLFDNPLLYISLFFFANAYTQNGNHNFNNFGNKSILLSGNVTGSVEDLAVSYYNPARLTEVENNSFSVNAKVYQLSRVRLKEAVGNGATFRDSEFKGVPSMIAGTFKVKNQKFAYTLMSKSAHETDLNYTTKTTVKDILNEFAGTEKYSGEIGIKSKFTEEWLGLSWANSITSRFSFGVSVFASIFNDQGESVFDYTIEHSQNRLATYKNIAGFEQTSYGIFIRSGINYALEKASIGVTISLPHIGVWNDGEFNYKDVVAGISSDKDHLVTNKNNNLKAARRTPFSIAIGSGIMAGKHKLHLNSSFYTGVKNYNRIKIPSFEQTDGKEIAFQFKESLKPVFNFGLGAEIFITRYLNGYLSFSTDYSGYENNANLFDLNSLSKKDTNFSQDFYHFGSGFELKLQSIQLILGSTYTRSSSSFSKPISSESDLGKESSYLNFQQWQFIVGLEIPVFGKKIKL